MGCIAQSAALISLCQRRACTAPAALAPSFADEGLETPQATNTWRVDEMAVAVKRRGYLRQDPRYELMLGTTFRSIGGYLDACCLRNSGTDDGCAVSLQCRRWWDKKCDRTRPELSEEEIVAIISQFEAVREHWLEKNSSALSSHRRLTVRC